MAIGIVRRCRGGPIGVAGLVLAGCLVVPGHLAGQAAASASPNTPFPIPAWAFPMPSAPSPPLADSGRLHRVPGSRRAFTALQVRDWFVVPDWFPDRHPPMPRVVAEGHRPDAIACGFCHLPDGSGRPENATVAGLPVEYIVAQVAAIRSGARRSASTRPFLPADLMRIAADSATDAEVREAAVYFSRIRSRQRARVIEANEVPRTRQGIGISFAVPGGGVEPLGTRIVELPVDVVRHEARDPGVEYLAYVPPGSIERGGAIVAGGVGGGQPCSVCHGAKLRGGPLGPPLAGRFPSYLLRQLLAFRTSARSSEAAAPMRAIAAKLTMEDMIAAAAFAGSQTP